jgi:hypothetical protein
MRREQRNNRSAVIGTFQERVNLLTRCGFVLDAMEASGRFDHTDLDGLRVARAGFLREPHRALWGLCSFTRQHRQAKHAGERTWRILVARELLYRTDDELERTIFHEFLHGIVGVEPEGMHGPHFSRLEGLYDVVISPHLTGSTKNGMPCSAA